MKYEEIKLSINKFEEKNIFSGVYQYFLKIK